MQAQHSEINLLRPHQVTELKGEIKALENKLVNPNIEDKGAVSRQLRQTSKMLEIQTPHAFEPDEVDDAVAREKQLLGQILEGMPSQEEMRKAPAGAVDKHRRWEKRNKLKIIEWKNLRLRLNAGTDQRDVANLERYRPKGSTLNMDSAVIQGRQFFMPETSGASVTFSDEQLALLRSVSPDLAERVALMSNEDRQQVKDVVGGIGLAREPTAPPMRKPKRRRKQQEARQEG